MVPFHQLQPAEFQAVVLCGPGHHLYPITDGEHLPKPLVPVAGKPLISYPLLWLEQEGIISNEKILSLFPLEYGHFLHINIFVYCIYFEFFEDVIVVVQRSSSAKVTHYLHKVYISSLKIQIVIQENENEEGTIDALLHIKPYLRTDFLVLPCDLIFNVPFKSIADMYRIERPTLMTVFSKKPILENDNKPPKADTSSKDKMF